VVFRQAVAERSFECLTRGYTGCGAAHAQYHRTEEFQRECRRGTSDHSCSDERSKLQASGNTQSAAHQTTEGRTYARPLHVFRAYAAHFLFPIVGREQRNLPEPPLAQAFRCLFRLLASCEDTNDRLHKYFSHGRPIDLMKVIEHGSVTVLDLAHEIGRWRRVYEWVGSLEASLESSVPLLLNTCSRQGGC